MTTTVRTPAIRQLIADATTKGWRVDLDDNRVDITKGTTSRRRDGRTHYQVMSGVRVFLTETGGFYYAHRLDVPLWSVNKIPTIKQVRKILKLATTEASTS